MSHFLWISEVARMALPSILSSLLFSDNCSQATLAAVVFCTRSKTGVTTGNRDSVNQSYEPEAIVLRSFPCEFCVGYC